MEGGTLVGTAFFILLVFAAWTSAISLIEPAVTWLVENKGLNRLHASIWMGVATWTFGLGTVFSFNIWSDYTWSIPYLFKDFSFFDTLDYLTSNIMLPMGGLFIAIFAAWLMRETSSRDELNTYNWFYKLWQILLRYITPIAVIIVFLRAVKAI